MYMFNLFYVCINLSRCTAIPNSKQIILYVFELLNNDPSGFSYLTNTEHMFITADCLGLQSICYCCLDHRAFYHLISLSVD